MRLLKLKVKGYKNLKNIEIDFSNTDGKILLVGKNGSGKSNLLEVLSAIFSSVYNAENNVTPLFEYDLEYKIRRKDDISSLIKASEVKVRITNGNKKNEVYYFEIGSDDKTNYKKIDSKNIIYLLPDHVIAVYSGEEMRLWNEYYFNSYEKYNKECFKGKTINEPRMLYFNHYYWELVASILAISDIDERKKELKSLGIENISKIDMTFDKKFIERNKNQFLKQIIESLNSDKKDKVSVQLDDYKKLISICGNEETLFKNMMVLLLPKDFKIITMFNISTENSIGIKELSEGEKKLLLIYGAINIAAGENLFLFDEPDSHVHESRKREIYDLICSDNKSQFVITSHSPAMSKLFNENDAFLISESNKEAIIKSCSMFSVINHITDGEWSLTDNARIVDNGRILALVEGKTDVQYIHKAIDIFSSKDDGYSKLKDIDFLQCGGTGNIPSTLEEIRKIVHPEKIIIVICDRDDAGDKAVKKMCNLEKGVNYNAIYKKDNKYYFELPKKNDYSCENFLIEDYFSEELKLKIVRDKISNLYGNMSNIPNKLREALKDDLSKYRFNNKDFNDFSVLLNKLLNIIEGIGPFEEVG